MPHFAPGVQPPAAARAAHLPPAAWSPTSTQITELPNTSNWLGNFPKLPNIRFEKLFHITLASWLKHYFKPAVRRFKNLPG